MEWVPLVDEINIMKNRPTNYLVLCALSMFMSGCSINSPSGMNGNWVADLSLPQAQGSVPVQSSFALTGRYDTANGISRLAGLPCISPNVPVNVTASQDVISLKTSLAATINSNTALTLTGTEASNFSTMNGTFTISGTDCGGLTSGTFVATKYQPLSGSYLGSFTSAQGNAITFLTSLDQSAVADETGRYPISGSASLTSSLCTSSSTLANSYVVGNTFSNVYVSADSSVLTVVGTFTEDAKTMNVQSFAISGGSCDGFQSAGAMLNITQTTAN